MAAQGLLDPILHELLDLRAEQSEEGVEAHSSLAIGSRQIAPALPAFRDSTPISFAARSSVRRLIPCSAATATTSCFHAPRGLSAKYISRNSTACSNGEIGSSFFVIPPPSREHG
jgi:hypothetical protein